MTNSIKYELPSILIEPSLSYIGDSRQVFDKNTILAAPPVSPNGIVFPIGLEIDADVAPHLMIVDIKVGKNSQLWSVGCIPASLFATSPPVRIYMDQIRPGLNLSLTLACTGTKPIAFKGRLLAKSSCLPQKQKPIIIGCGYTEVTAGETRDIVVASQAKFHLKRLHISPHLLDVFRIDSLFQGRYLDVERASQARPSQLGKQQLLRGGVVTLSPCKNIGINQPITVRVTNTSKTTQYFSGALLGTST